MWWLSCLQTRGIYLCPKIYIQSIFLFLLPLTSFHTTIWFQNAYVGSMILWWTNRLEKPTNCAPYIETLNKLKWYHFSSQNKIIRIIIISACCVSHLISNWSMLQWNSTYFCRKCKCCIVHVQISKVSSTNGDWKSGMLCLGWEHGISCSS